MVKTFGVEYPERPLMSTLSDLLGIPHFMTANGSTVKLDFLQAVAQRLGLPTLGVRKDPLLASIWEYAQRRRPMPADRYSPGGTVTNDVLQEIIDGLLEHGFDGFDPVQVTNDEIDLMVDVSDLFDAANFSDERTRRVAKIAVREAQDKFRTAVLEAYQGKCAMSQVAVPAALEAAHIAAYRGPKFNAIPNGIALRRDLHALYDRGMLAVHENELQILVAPILAGTPYEEFNGLKMLRPRAKDHRPSTAALRAHRLWAGLGDI